MRKTCLTVVVVALVAAPAMADPRGPGDEIYSATWIAWRYAQGLNNWCFDDLELDWSNPGSSGSVLDTVRFSLAHAESGIHGTYLTGANVDIAFYVHDGVNAAGTPTTPYLGGFNVDFPEGSIHANTGEGVLHTAEGVGLDLAYDDDSNPLTPDVKPDQIWAGLIYNSITGDCDPSAVGQQLVLAQDWIGEGIGLTQDGFFESPRIPGPPTGTMVNWGFPDEGPPANFLWELTVPEPSTLSLLGLAGVALLRRRR